MTSGELSRAMARIGELVNELEQVPDEDTRERARALVQTLLELHRAGLSRLLELVAARAPGSPVIDELAADETVALLFSLHDLHIHSVAERVAAAIDSLAQRLREQGVGAELVSVTDETVRVRLKAVGVVRAGAAGLRTELEASVRRSAPEIAVVDIDGLDSSDVPLTRLSGGPPRS